MSMKRFATACRVRDAADSKPEDRVLTFTIQTERIALDNGVLLADGIDAEDYMRNPVVLANHKQWSLPIGSTTRLARLEGENGWEADVKFLPAGTNEEADKTYAVYRALGHGAASVGFNVLERSAPPTEDEQKKYGVGPGHWVGKRWKLIEWSIVTIGADPGAVMHAGGAEGRALRRAFAAIGVERASALMAPAEARTVTGSTMRAEDAAAEQTDNDSAESGDDSTVALLKQIVDALDRQQSMLAEIHTAMTAMDDDESMEENEGEKSADGEFVARLGAALKDARSSLQI